MNTLLGIKRFNFSNGPLRLCADTDNHVEIWDDTARLFHARLPDAVSRDRFIMLVEGELLDAMLHGEPGLSTKILGRLRDLSEQKELPPRHMQQYVYLRKFDGHIWKAPFEPLDVDATIIIDSKVLPEAFTVIGMDLYLRLTNGEQFCLGATMTLPSSQILRPSEEFIDATEIRLQFYTALPQLILFQNTGYYPSGWEELRGADLVAATPIIQRRGSLYSDAIGSENVLMVTLDVDISRADSLKLLMTEFRRNSQAKGAK